MFGYHPVEVSYKGKTLMVGNNGLCDVFEWLESEYVEK